MSTSYNIEPPTTAEVILHTTAGPIPLELFGKQTPLATRNFLQHCLDGYYDNTIFHRLIPGFIIQGGDPTGLGSGGESAIHDDGRPFEDEFHQRLKYTRRGLVGMANAGGKNENASQFFITLGPTAELNGKNTLFGRVKADGIFTVLKMADMEIVEGTEDRPMYPTKVERAEIVLNPFDDMKPRVVAATRAGGADGEDDGVGKKGKKKKKAKKVLLSFGEDEDEMDDIVADQPRFNMALVAQNAEAEERQRRKKEKKGKKGKKERRSRREGEYEDGDGEDGLDEGPVGGGKAEEDAEMEDVDIGRSRGGAVDKRKSDQEESEFGDRRRSKRSRRDERARSSEDDRDEVDVRERGFRRSPSSPTEPKAEPKSRSPRQSHSHSPSPPPSPSRSVDHSRSRDRGRKDRDDSSGQPEDDPDTKRESKLASTKAQIEALKASMRTRAHDSDSDGDKAADPDGISNPDGPGSRAAKRGGRVGREEDADPFEAMIPKTAIRGRKRRGGGDANGADGAASGPGSALSSFLQFKKRLETGVDGSANSRTGDGSRAPKNGVREDGGGDDGAVSTHAPSQNADASEEGGIRGGEREGGELEEENTCDLHFIANCQSCKSWDRQVADRAAAEEGWDDSDPSWMNSHRLSFAKDRESRAEEWRRKNESGETVVIDPREGDRHGHGRVEERSGRATGPGAGAGTARRERREWDRGPGRDRNGGSGRR